mmetsp:Transcript_7203/g.12558  ORF Transcript_7203/g.12558 Transcript_7203/m.12558 type:complete len:228 (-) Transcript_7203:214-897(-)
MRDVTIVETYRPIRAVLCPFPHQSQGIFEQTFRPPRRVARGLQDQSSCFWTRVSLPDRIDTAAAPKENSAPIFAASCTGPGSKATAATKSETVKPMAATKPITTRSIRRIPCGSPNRRGFAANHPNRKMPTGLPISRPARTSHVASPIAEKATPAFIRPNRPRMISTGYFSACSMVLRRSCRCSSAAENRPKARSAWGIVGTMGSRPRAGCRPDCMKPYQLRQPAMA